MWKDDKTYPYVRSRWARTSPASCMTRRKARDGGVYFGPYPKVGPVKGLLRYLWRQQFFPLRPCRWDFSLGEASGPRKINACLYYHTGECPAPCAGKHLPERLPAIAERAVLFFRGATRSSRAVRAEK